MPGDAHERDGHAWDASAYVSRSLRVQGGEDVTALDPDRVGIIRADGSMDDAHDARAVHAEVLAAVANHRDGRPLECARTQLLYDNWIEEERERTLQYTDPEVVFAQLQEAITACTEPLVQELPPYEPEPRQFFVMFAFDKAALSEEAMKVVAVAIDEAKMSGGAVIVIGHADRAGGDDYNFRLSLARAESIAAALVEAGVSADQISIEARGESDPLVPTEDGERNPAQPAGRHFRLLRRPAVQAGEDAAPEADLGILPVWRLEDLYESPDSPRIGRDLAWLEGECAAFASELEGRLVRLDGNGLFDAFRRFEAVVQRKRRLSLYAELRFQQNTQDPDRGKFLADIHTRLTEATRSLVFFTLELNRIDDPALSEFFAACPRLRHYRVLARSRSRDATASALPGDRDVRPRLCTGPGCGLGPALLGNGFRALLRDRWRKPFAGARAAHPPGA